MDAEELGLLTQTLTKTMTTAPSGPALYAALCGLGWHEMLAETPDDAVPLVFRLLGETGSHAPVLDDVIVNADAAAAGGTDTAMNPAPSDAAAGAPLSLPLRLPFAGGRAVSWGRSAEGSRETGVDAALPLTASAGADPMSVVALAAGRRAVGWWLLGCGRAMLALSRAHAVDRVQFGKPIASFQAVRHKLAETLVALEGAEAVLAAAGTDELSSTLAKAAAGQAALLAARHCQQVLGGIGFTAEHSLHRHVKRVLVLDCLMGSSRELVREAGRHVIREGAAPRLVDL